MCVRSCVRAFFFVLLQSVFRFIENRKKLITHKTNKTMKKIEVILAVVIAMVMASCVKFKTEATVDVSVVKDGKSVGSGVVVYKFGDIGLGESSTLYKSNASGKEVTDASGLAKFELKSPDDFTPSDVAGVEIEETNSFFFCTYDSQDRRNGMVTVSVKTGDKKTVTLEIKDIEEE